MCYGEVCQFIKSCLTNTITSHICRYYIEFLDECLRGNNKGNILQENLFIVLTSSEMVLLCRSLAILHYTVCMPMRWLSGNTHFLGRCGFDWSARSMGKAIDALEAAMIDIDSDGSLYLNEEWMRKIFSNIYTDEYGNEGPLAPLEDAMKYQFEHKLTPAVDGSKVLPHDQLMAELFYPQHQVNIDTTETVKLMACEIAHTILKELRDPNKATSDYLTSADGKFSWGETTDEEHAAFLGKMATNDSAESPFASLTRQLQQFGRMLGIHASAVGHARINGDFNRDFKNSGNDGAYHRLSDEMRSSLLTFALQLAPVIRKSEKTALDKQREAKRVKQEQLRKKKMLAMQTEYAHALTYIDMFNSVACWRTKSIATTEFGKIQSKTAKLDAVKEQIRIRVLGFGWKDLHHPWSKDCVDYSPEELLAHLVDTIIPQQRSRGIPDMPTMDLPSRRDTKQLGTKTVDVEDMDRRYEAEKGETIAKAIKMRDDQEDKGESDRYEKLQPRTRPEVNESLIGVEMEQLWEYTEPDGVKELLSELKLVIEFTYNGIRIVCVRVVFQQQRKYL